MSVDHLYTAMATNCRTCFWQSSENFWWRHIPVFNGIQDFGLNYCRKRKFWVWTILVLSGISQRTPTFQISTSKKCYKSMQNPSNKPCFRASRLLCIRWWGRIWLIQTYNGTHFIYVSPQWPLEIQSRRSFQYKDNILYTLTNTYEINRVWLGLPMYKIINISKLVF